MFNVHVHMLPGCAAPFYVRIALAPSRSFNFNNKAYMGPLPGCAAPLYAAPLYVSLKA